MSGGTLWRYLQSLPSKSHFSLRHFYYHLPINSRDWRNFCGFGKPRGKSIDHPQPQCLFWMKLRHNLPWFILNLFLIPLLPDLPLIHFWYIFGLLWFTVDSLLIHILFFCDSLLIHSWLIFDSYIFNSPSIHIWFFKFWFFCLNLYLTVQCVNAGSLCHIAYGKRTKTEVSRYAYVSTINVFYTQYFKAFFLSSLAHRE